MGMGIVVAWGVGVVFVVGVGMGLAFVTGVGDGVVIVIGGVGVGVCVRVHIVVAGIALGGGGIGVVFVIPILVAVPVVVVVDAVVVVGTVLVIGTVVVIGAVVVVPAVVFISAVVVPAVIIIPAVVVPAVIVVPTVFLIHVVVVFLAVVVALAVVTIVIVPAVVLIPVVVLVTVILAVVVLTIVILALSGGGAGAVVRVGSGGVIVADVRCVVLVAHAFVVSLCGGIVVGTTLLSTDESWWGCIWDVLASQICSGGAMVMPLSMSFHSALDMSIESKKKRGGGRCLQGEFGGRGLAGILCSLLATGFPVIDGGESMLMRCVPWLFPPLCLCLLPPFSFLPHLGPFRYLIHHFRLH